MAGYDTTRTIKFSYSQNFVILPISS